MTFQHVLGVSELTEEQEEEEASTAPDGAAL